MKGETKKRTTANIFFSTFPSEGEMGHLQFCGWVGGRASRHRLSEMLWANTGLLPTLKPHQFVQDFRKGNQSFSALGPDHQPYRKASLCREPNLISRTHQNMNKTKMFCCSKFQVGYIHECSVIRIVGS